jgi:hypothetical protein
MSRILTAQTLGSVLVAGSLVLSEVAVRLLNAFPWSATLWYVHLAIFAPIVHVRADPSPLTLLLRQGALAEFSLLLLLTVVVWALRFRLGVALLAHLGFGTSIMIARTWIVDPQGALVPSLLLSREAGGTCLVAILLAVSGVACALSHLSFIIEIARSSGSPIGRPKVHLSLLRGSGHHAVSLPGSEMRKAGSWRSGARVIGMALTWLKSLRRSHAAFIGQPGTGGRDAAGTVGGGGLALRHSALLAGGLLMLIGSGCQSDPVASADPPAFESGILSSNEANRLGRADLAAGNYGNAERHFRIAVEKDPNDVPSWIGLAAAYDNLGRFELADRAYARLAALQGETFELINNRGYSYLLRGDRTRAAVEFKRALAIDPSNPVVRNNLLLLQSGERPNRDVPI